MGRSPSSPARGRGIALGVSREGANVMVLRRTVSKCEALVEEITARGGEALAEECSVESRDQMETRVQWCVERWGRVDLLVNNASTWTYESLRKTTDDDMETMGQSEPMASLRFMQSCLSHLRDSQGCVVNIGSGTSLLPMAGTGGHSVTKEAVRVLSLVGAVEWGWFGIRVNPICPVGISPYTEARESDRPGAIDRPISMIRLGRVGDARPPSADPLSTSAATPVGMSPARPSWWTAGSVTYAALSGPVPK